MATVFDTPVSLAPGTQEEPAHNRPAQLVRGDDERRDVEISIVDLDPATGRVHAMLLQDISHRREAERRAQIAFDVFEPGRMNAVGIFLGRRASEGYSVNILSTSRRRDRIVVVFEERMPAEFMMAQRAPAPSSPRPVAIAPSAPSGFAGGAGAGFAPSGTGANLAPPPPPARGGAARARDR